MAASVASGRSPGTIPYPPSVSRGTPPRLRCNLPRLRHHREDGSLLLDLCLSLASSDQPHRLLHPRGDLVAHIGVLGQEGLGVLPALPDLVAIQEVPGPGLHDDPPLGRGVEQRPFLRDAVAVLDVKLGLPEGGTDLGLYNLDPHPGTDNLLPVLDVLDLADIEPDRGVELERPPAGSGFGRVVHHDPVDEVVVAPLDLDVETMGAPGGGLGSDG